MFFVKYSYCSTTVLVSDCDRTVNTQAARQHLHSAASPDSSPPARRELRDSAERTHAALLSLPRCPLLSATAALPLAAGSLLCCAHESPRATHTMKTGRGHGQ